MATRLEAGIDSRGRAVRIAGSTARNRALSLEERMEWLHRRHRVSRAQSALEGAVWLAGSSAVLLLAAAGVFGFR